MTAYVADIIARRTITDKEVRQDPSSSSSPKYTDTIKYALDVKPFVIDCHLDNIEVFLKKRNTPDTKKPLRLLPEETGIVYLDVLDDDTFELEIYDTSVEPVKLLHKLVIIKNHEGIRFDNGIQQEHATNIFLLVLFMSFVVLSHFFGATRVFCAFVMLFLYFVFFT